MLQQFLDDILTIPINELFSNIVYNAKGSNVETVLIDGKIVMEDKIINGLNVSDIKEKSIKIANRILN